MPENSNKHKHLNWCHLTRWNWTKNVRLMAVRCVRESLSEECCGRSWFRPDNKKYLYHLISTLLELTVRTWKMVVGRRSFPFGMAHFQVRTVSFREGTVIVINHLESSWLATPISLGLSWPPGIFCTPWKIDMETKNHLSVEENHLNQTFIFGFHVNFQGCNAHHPPNEQRSKPCWHSIESWLVNRDPFLAYYNP